MLYPIAYGLDDGGNKITVTDGFVFFGILDCLTVPVIAAGVLVLSRGWDYKKLNVYFTQYGRVASSEFPEQPKAAPVVEPKPEDQV